MYQTFGYIAGILALISYAPYYRDILRGRARPERATWLLWSVLAGIAFFSQLSKGAHQSLWFTGFDSAGAFVTLLLALKYGLGGLKKRDVVGLLIAALGLIVWHYTHNAIYALAITIGIDVIGVSLTVWKTLDHPDSETYTMWLLVSLAGALAAVSVGKFDATLIAYPLYICLANLAVVAAIFIGQHRKVT